MAATTGPLGGRLGVGKGKSAVPTLVERKNRFVLVVALPNGNTAEVVADALSDRSASCPCSSSAI